MKKSCTAKITSLLLAVIILFAAMSSTILSASAEESQPTVTWSLPQSIKVGQAINDFETQPFTSLFYATVLNLPSEYNYVKVHNNGGDDLYGRAQVGGFAFDTDEDGNRAYISESDGKIGAFPFGAKFYKPGNFSLQLEAFNGYWDDTNNKWIYNKTLKLGEPYAFTVEEPVITSNAPASIKTGSTVDFTTALTNTALENESLTDIDNPDDWIIDDDYFHYEKDPYAIIYRPSVTIIEGADLVTQSNKDYTNTLKTSENLTFTKSGTVKLKVTYEQTFASSEASDGVTNYNSEKIIIINVADEDIQIPETTAKTTEISGRMLDNSGTPMANVVVALFSNPITAVTDSNGYFTLKDVPVSETAHTLRVFATEADLAKYIADPNSVKPLAEIKNVVITETDGKTVITIDGKTVDFTDGVMFQVGADGNIIVNPPTSDTTKSPETGDNTNMALMLALMALSAGVLVFVGKRKKAA